MDIWGAASIKGVEFAYREGMEAVLKDDNIDAVVPVLMLARETGPPPSYEFILDLAKKYPEKPVLVSFSAAKNARKNARHFASRAECPPSRKSSNLSRRSPFWCNAGGNLAIE